MRKIEVHNAWTIYGMNRDGSESKKKLASLERPQDWGHPRWHYEFVRFEWPTEEAHYVNHCHLWTDLKRERWQVLEMFASLIVKIMQPGLRSELCGREYLDLEDFWSKEWGPQPPIFEREYDEIDRWGDWVDSIEE